MPLLTFLLVLGMLLSPVRLLASPPNEEKTTLFYLLYQISLNGGSAKEATRYLEKALGQKPGDKTLLFQKASLLGDKGELNKAKEIAKQLEAENPHAVETLLLLGKIASAEGDHPLAAHYFQKATKEKPDSEETVLLLTQELALLKNFDRALTVLEAYHRRNPEETNALFFRASLYFHFMNQPFKAVDTYREILKIEPDNTKALAAIIDIDLAKGKKREALKVLQEAVRKNPSEITLRLRLALLQYELKFYKEAISHFQSILKDYPNFDKITYYLGVIYENRGMIQEALGEFGKIPASGDFYKEAGLHRAYLHVQTKKEEEAMEILREALKKRPEISEFYEYLSEIYRDRGENLAAIRVLEEGIGRVKDKSRLLYAQGILYDKTGEFKKSIKAMRRVLKLSPDNAHALNFIGYTYAEKGIHLDEAEKLVKKALELKPEDGYITDSLGWVYFRKGKFDEAFLYIGKAYQLIPQEPAIVEHLGDLYLKKSRREIALRYFEESLGLLSKKKELDQDKNRDIERLREKIEKIKSQP
ncbi:MAG: tetratricopeptide repeat protein [Deltaproteobacteria bacterium]|nr:tetratricopeptide repeat protein [Deltaproteobacteria bacterium]